MMQPGPFPPLDSDLKGSGVLALVSADELTGARLPSGFNIWIPPLGKSDIP